MTTSMDIGLLVLRTATAAFFITTGYRKLFLPEVRNKVIPFIASHAKGNRKIAYAVVAGEFFGGIAIGAGFLTHIAAAGLFIIMAGAYITDTVPDVLLKNAYNTGKTQWSKLFSNLLCTPEWQLLMIVLFLAIVGGGAFSIDALL